LNGKEIDLVKKELLKIPCEPLPRNGTIVFNNRRKKEK